MPRIIGIGIVVVGVPIPDDQNIPLGIVAMPNHQNKNRRESFRGGFLFHSKICNGVICDRTTSTALPVGSGGECIADVLVRIDDASVVQYRSRFDPTTEVLL